MNMRKECDLKKLRVKRHSLLPELQDEKSKPAKVRITISLEQDIVEYFKVKFILRAWALSGYLDTFVGPQNLARSKYLCGEKCVL